MTIDLYRSVGASSAKLRDWKSQPWDRLRHRMWKLKDEKHDILVMRREGGFFDVNVSMTLPNGGIRRVTTQIKASPGQTIPLGGLGDARITFTQSG